MNGLAAEPMLFLTGHTRCAVGTLSTGEEGNSKSIGTRKLTLLKDKRSGAVTCTPKRMKEDRHATSIVLIERKYEMANDIT